MADSNGKRFSDRKEGRLLRGLPAAANIDPYIRRTRSGAAITFADPLEVTEIEQWLVAKRQEGARGLSLIHLLAAAYVRTVALRPGINRFVSARHIFARDDIRIVLHIRRSADSDAPSTTVKVFCSPTDTVYDVYRRINDAIDDVHSGSGDTQFDRFAAKIARLPRFFLRQALALVRCADYFDKLPNSVLESSPYHGSLALYDLGALGIGPAEETLPDFGNLPLALSFGAKRRVKELDKDGNAVERRYVDLRFTCDGRICDSAYLVSALKGFRYLLKNPSILELPPERTEDDVN